MKKYQLDSLNTTVST